MFEDLWYFWEQYRHLFALAACIWFHLDCKRKQRYLTTPTDYFVWGMITIGVVMHFKNLRVG